MRPSRRDSICLQLVKRLLVPQLKHIFTSIYFSLGSVCTHLHPSSSSIVTTALPEISPVFMRLPAQPVQICLKQRSRARAYWSHKGHSGPSPLHSPANNNCWIDGAHLPSDASLRIGQGKPIMEASAVRRSTWPACGTALRGIAAAGEYSASSIGPPFMQVQTLHLDFPGASVAHFLSRILLHESSVLSYYPRHEVPHPQCRDGLLLPRLPGSGKQ